MSIPTIEELVAPHLERLRREAEAKYGDKVGIVQLWFKDRANCPPNSGESEYVALVDKPFSHNSFRSGFGATIDEAIKDCVKGVEPLPDVAAILGTDPDGTFIVCPVCGVDQFATNAKAHSVSPPMVPWSKCVAMNKDQPCPMNTK